MSDSTLLADPGDDRQLFSTWLAEHRAGALDDQLTAALVEVAEQVALEAKNGSLTLKLTLSEKGGGVIVAHELKTTLPKVKTEAFYYLTAGGLSTRDPRQPSLPGTSPQEMRDAEIASRDAEIARLKAALAADITTTTADTEGTPDA